ncbi:MAG: UPF0173 metal-dependent hydrolase AF_1265, partial [uncultured Rubrobacteraceae bacterium]
GRDAWRDQDQLPRACGLQARDARRRADSHRPVPVAEPDDPGRSEGGRGRRYHLVDPRPLRPHGRHRNHRAGDGRRRGLQLRDLLLPAGTGRGERAADPEGRHGPDRRHKGNGDQRLPLLEHPDGGRVPDLRRRADGVRRGVRERLPPLPRGRHLGLRRHATHRRALPPGPGPPPHRRPPGNGTTRGRPRRPPARRRARRPDPLQPGRPAVLHRHAGEAPGAPRRGRPRGHGSRHAARRRSGEL